MLQVVPGTSQLSLKFVSANVHASSGAFLDGKPMTDVSLHELMGKLNAAGMFEKSNQDTVLELRRDVTLGIFGDDVDVVIIGTRSAQRAVEVNDPTIVKAIISAVEHARHL